MCETKLGDVVAYFEVDLEGRFSKVRSEETNLGNFCADVILGKVSVQPEYVVCFDSFFLGNHMKLMFVYFFFVLCCFPQF